MQIITVLFVCIGIFIGLKVVFDRPLKRFIDEFRELHPKEDDKGKDN